MRKHDPMLAKSWPCFVIKRMMRKSMILAAVLTMMETATALAQAVAVDLGLPSGTKWANMNVGATSPQESGLYFAWGETTGYTDKTTDGRQFDWANYKWMAEGQSSWKYINKYQNDDGQTEASWYENDGYKFVGDGLTVLEVTDDAAAANWGGFVVI